MKGCDVTTLDTAWTPLTGTTHAVAVEVLIHGPLSRSELARRLDLSAGTLTRITKPLLDSGLLVEELELRPSGMGRPSQPLDVIPSSHHFIGVKLTGTQAHAVLTTLRADVVATETIGIPDTSPAGVVEGIAELVARLSTRVERVTAIGVSIGGKASDHAVVESAQYLGWSDVPLVALVEKRLGIPCVIENDVTAWTQAEHWFGAGRDVESFALLTIGVGIGYGLVVHDRLVEGPDVGVGLMGHIPLSPLGPLCDEGHVGCSSAMLSSPAITARVGIGVGRAVTYEECFALREEGNAVANRVVQESAAALGGLVALIANLTAVDKIVISGDGVQLADDGWSEVEAAIERRRHPRASKVAVEIKHAEFTEWARGAAVTAIQTFVLGNE